MHENKCPKGRRSREEGNKLGDHTNKKKAERYDITTQKKLTTTTTGKTRRVHMLPGMATGERTGLFRMLDETTYTTHKVGGRKQAG